MSSTDIYKVKESPKAKAGDPSVLRRRRRHSPASFEETVTGNVSNTHRRRRHNSGIRRFRHLMKRPGFSRKFWMITLSSGALILILILVWDWFFRYPNSVTGS